MLRYAIIFLVIPVAAAVLGFGDIAGASAGITQIVFYIFLALFSVGLVTRLMERVLTEMKHKARGWADQHLSHSYTVYR